MRFLVIVSLVSLAACSGGGDEAGLTSAEDQQLDEAAAALDEAQEEYEAAIQTVQTDAETAEQGGESP